MREKRKKEEITETRKGRLTSSETLENWYHVASLHVLRGLNQSQAYMQVYGAKSGANASVLFNNPKFKAIINRLRLSQGLSENDVRSNIESLYIQCLTSEDESMKNKLAAAAQWQKLRGLEKSVVKVESEEDLLFAAALQKCEKSLQVAKAERVARGRVVAAENDCGRADEALEGVSEPSLLGGSEGVENEPSGGNLG
jgi:hypothetical protein